MVRQEAVADEVSQARSVHAAGEVEVSTARSVRETEEMTASSPGRLGVSKGRDLLTVVGGGGVTARTMGTGVSGEGEVSTGVDGDGSARAAEAWRSKVSSGTDFLNAGGTYTPRAAAAAWWSEVSMGTDFLNAGRTYAARAAAAVAWWRNVSTGTHFLNAGGTYTPRAEGAGVAPTARGLSDTEVSLSEAHPSILTGGGARLVPAALSRIQLSLLDARRPEFPRKLEPGAKRRLEEIRSREKNARGGAAAAAARKVAVVAMAPNSRSRVWFDV